jgi:hypothetical protein
LATIRGTNLKELSIKTHDSPAFAVNHLPTFLAGHQWRANMAEIRYMTFMEREMENDRNDDGRGAS